MKKPLSLSSTQNYLECGQKYKLDKIDRIRPIAQPSYFVFGSAVDKALNALIEGLSQDEIEAALYSELDRVSNEDIEFFEIDYDGEIIPEEVRAVTLEECQRLGYQGNNIDALAKSLLERPRHELSDKQKLALTACCYVSLASKALLMIDAYRDKVLPLINKVEGVQKEIKWKDAKGNEFIGVLDMIVDLEGIGSVVADNKTASRPYADDSVRLSSQLAIYTKVENKTKAVFIVMEKRIRKNRIKTCSVCGNVGTGRHKTCEAMVAAPDKNGDHFEGVQARCGGEWTETIKPEVNIQIIVDEVSRAEQDITQAAMSDVAEAIKAKVFPKNIKNCIQQFGQKKVKCPYYDYCRSGSMDGLKIKPEGER